MSTSHIVVETPVSFSHPGIEQEVVSSIHDVISLLPDPATLSLNQCRLVIARYAAVLEGNFIYWMTGAYLSARTDAARSIVADNLLEEVRDAHPHMLRKFLIAADAFPTEADAMSIYTDLTAFRLFIGRLEAGPILAAMAFFEGFIQKFMGFLAEVARRRGSSEMEYTDVHGVCDVAHTAGLFRALHEELAFATTLSRQDLFEGVTLLRNLMLLVLAPALASEN
ncbi:MAG TPA: iron-containing redox enzyme family protein [Terriglobales bacterium]|nr:iron-containing redox enzyme family protein [Terriglobales bacterium]